MLQLDDMVEVEGKEPIFPVPSRRDELAAAYTEELLSPDFLKARNVAFEETAGDSELYSLWRDSAEEYLGRIALLDSIPVSPEERSSNVWELQRQAVITIVDGGQTGDLGPFVGYIFNQKPDGKIAEAEAGSDDGRFLPPGEKDIITTNTRIMALRDRIKDPVFFYNEGLALIDARKQVEDVDFVGPENYATLLKFTADKIRALPDEEKKEIQFQLSLEPCLDGFFEISERDTPNVIEMTNILSAINTFPKGTVSEKYTEKLLRYSLEVLPDFSPRGINVLLNAVAKLDLTNHGEAAAYTVDLALRKGSNFERTTNLQVALRAVAQLPKSCTSEQAFNTLLERRNMLEVAANFTGLLEISNNLLRSVESVTENQADIEEAKKIAEGIFLKTAGLYKQRKDKGDLRDDLDRKLVWVLRKVRENYERM